MEQGSSFLRHGSSSLLWPVAMRTVDGADDRGGMMDTLEKWVLQGVRFDGRERGDNS